MPARRYGDDSTKDGRAEDGVAPGVPFVSAARFASSSGSESVFLTKREHAFSKGLTLHVNTVEISTVAIRHLAGNVPLRVGGHRGCSLRSRLVQR